MTEAELQAKLFSIFETLNNFSGIEFIKDNVKYPNKIFTEPKNRSWFKLSCLFNKPEVIGEFTDGQNRWNGILQIDIYTPLGKGEKETDNKIKWIERLFSRGKTFDDILIISCYKAQTQEDGDFFKAVLRIEWEADVDKE